ncbi:glycosyltransferase [Actinobacillus equuli]|uniref:glycosyltransferase n=1 Tax=Actinobacillus equuli TaxID=718 RepID=UPI003C6FB407
MRFTVQSSISYNNVKILINHTNMNIALAANQAYADYLTTTIKSICYHNKNVRFFILNRDFPHEWFHTLNCKLAKLNSTVIDIKISDESIKNFKTSRSIFHRIRPIFATLSRVLLLKIKFYISTAI